MNTICKVCLDSLGKGPLPYLWIPAGPKSLSVAVEQEINVFVCQTCWNYALGFTKDEVIYYELIKNEPFGLRFHVQENKAHLVKNFSKSFMSWPFASPINSFSLKELTHELAIQWVNKLKTYTVFQ
jgi:hypothetical protein